MTQDALETAAEGADLEANLFAPLPADLAWQSFQPAVRAEGNTEALKILTTLRQEERPATPAEQRALSRYVGWGALEEVLNANTRQRWAANAQEQLEAFFMERAATRVGSPDWGQAQLILQASVLNAHYTSPEVVDALWQSALTAGFQGGRVLEPAAGAGIFLGLMPPEVRRRSQVTAVEIDPIAADVLRALYPEVQVREGPFEKQSFPPHFFDAVITNVPFANVAVYDQGQNRQYRSLHDYFIERSLSLLRPGGIGVFLTSAYTLDKMNPATREALGRMGRLLAVARLPANSQSAQAGTEVVEDALIFRALFPGEAPDTSFLESRPISLLETVNTQELREWYPDHGIDPPEGADAEIAKAKRLGVNSVFWGHPERILGRFEVNGRFGGKLSIAARAGAVLGPRLQETLHTQIQKQAREAPPQGVTVLENPLADSAPVVALPPQTAGEEGWISGLLCLHPEGDPPSIIELGLPTISGENEDENEERWTYRVVAPLDSPQGRILTDVIAVREALREVFRSDTDAARDTLNAAYDTCVERHGLLTTPKVRRLFQDDPYAGRLLALIVQDPETKALKKADIFTRSLHENAAPPAPHTVDNISDAMLTVYVQRGVLDDEALRAIDDLLTPAARESGQESIETLLIEKGLVFRDPARQTLVLRAQYLSGYLLDRLTAAREAARTDPQYEINVQALESALPPQVGPGDLLVDMGASWVPDTVVNDFLRSLLPSIAAARLATTPMAIYHEMTGWVLTEQGHRVLNSVGHLGTSRVQSATIVGHLLQRKPIMVYDESEGPSGETVRVLNRPETQAAQKSAEQVKARFQTFLWEDAGRARLLCDIYNRQFNSYVTPTYEASAQSPPPTGMSPSLTMYPTQKNMVFRAICEQCGDIGHDVGMGKTLTIIVAAHEMVRLGLARHPMIVVKKSTLVQFAQAAQMAFPHNRYIVMDNKDLSPKGRARFLAQAMTQRCDAIIVTHETFRAMDISREVKERVILDEIVQSKDSLEALQSAGVRNFTVKQIAKRVRSLEARLKSVMEEGHDAIRLDTDLRIDLLFVDEAHAFKRYESERSRDMLMKTNAIRHLRNDPYGVFLATATPISNTLNEIHTMIRYTHPDLLRRTGLATLEAFRSTFISERSHWEPHHAGAGWVLRSRDHLINVPDVIRMFLTTTDRRTIERDAPGIIKTPEKVIHTVEVPMSRQQQAMMDEIAARALGKSNLDGETDHVFTLMDLAAKTSCDMRLLPEKERQNVLDSVGAFDPDDETSSKIAVVAREVAKIYHETSERKGTQMVFLDMGVPGGQNAIDLYADLTRRLVKLGIPETEIAAIHDATTDAARADLFARVNSGAIRILEGSSGKMSEGVNAQELLCAIHLVLPPWRPDIVEQSIGRMIRQGNRNDQGHVYFYASVSQEGAVSPDAFRYQLLQRKIDTFRAILSGEYTQRTFDLEAVMTMGEIAATASGNPLVMEKFKADAEIAESEAQTRFLLSERQRLHNALSTNEYRRGAYNNTRLFEEALPTIEEPEVWFLCDHTETPIKEIGDRQDFLKYIKTRVENEVVWCRNTPVSLVGLKENTRFLVRLAYPAIDPNGMHPHMVNQARFSSPDRLVKRLHPARHAEILADVADKQSALLKEHHEIEKKIEHIQTTLLPESDAKTERARAELAHIEQRLLDQEKGRQATRAALTGTARVVVGESCDNDDRVAVL
ncbi:MAG: SNF2-related protein [Gammaproteobacteria bacterium]|nr:SNF2-related protein [Gammaproteobacteria bacterium]